MKSADDEDEEHGKTEQPEQLLAEQNEDPDNQREQNEHQGLADPA